jgi:hypothetical protein
MLQSIAEDRQAVPCSISTVRAAQVSQVRHETVWLLLAGFRDISKTRPIERVEAVMPVVFSEDSARYAKSFDLGLGYFRPRKHKVVLDRCIGHIALLNLT